MSYWIFKCDPDSFRLDARFADPFPTISWIVTRYRDQIERDDTALVWQTGPKRGFRAILQLDSDPKIMPELKSEQKYNKEHDTEERYRVLATIKEREMNLPHTLLRNTPGLEELSMFHGYQQGTNFKMTEKEFRTVLKLHAQNA
jgi:hypothetical protein